MHSIMEYGEKERERPKMNATTIIIFNFVNYERV